MNETASWRQAGLTDHEYERIVKLLGRNPNETELGMFAALWSEHCSYKHSRHLFHLFPTEAPHVLQSLGENAGVIDIGDKLAVTFKIESHNSPSAVTPFHGAATGVGGILRDIISMGARPIAVLGSLRFGSLENERTRRLFKGVVEGMSDYANNAHIPIVAGEIGFDERFQTNPLVNVMAVGLVAHENIATASAEGVGNVVIVAGAPTGRDGIMGAGFSSADLEEDNAPQKTQVGDPFAGRALIEATLEVISGQLVAGIQDMGAAGLTSSAAEMAAKAGTGIDIDLLKVPRSEEGMTPYEMMLSESQERMLIVSKPGKESEIIDVFHKFGLEAVACGHVTDDGILTVREGETIAAEIPAALLTDEAPSYVTEEKQPDYMQSLTQGTLPNDISGNANELLLRLLGDPNVASATWALRQADYMVGDRTMTAPGKADAGLINLNENGKALAAAVYCNSLHAYIDPKLGAMAAVAGAARKLVSVGAKPLALTDGMNFGNPEKGDVYMQFKEAVLGIAEAASFLDTPVIGGNVSFYNETKVGAVMPTPIIGMVGLIEQANNHITSAFKTPGDAIILLGQPGADGAALGGSRYLKTIHGMIKGPIPTVDLTMEKRLHTLMLQAVDHGLLKSATNVAEGGLAVSLAKSAALGGYGVRCQLDFGGRLDALLFGEAFGRIVVSTTEEDAQKLSALADECGVVSTLIGRVTGSGFVVSSATGGVDLTLKQLSECWINTIPTFMGADDRGRLDE